MVRLFRIPSRLLAAVAVLGLVFTTGCAEDRPEVVVIGDSLTAWSAPHVADTLESMGWDAAIDARPGWTIQGYESERWVPIIRQIMQSHHPSVVVVELGTNTCAGCDLAKEIDDVMAAIGDHPVRWLNVRTYAPIPKDPNSSNDALQAATRRHPNLRIIDFDAIFQGHTEWVESDRIHMSVAGADALALVIASGAGRPDGD